jgi:hypothetical protein
MRTACNLLLFIIIYIGPNHGLLHLPYNNLPQNDLLASNSVVYQKDHDDDVLIQIYLSSISLFQPMISHLIDQNFLYH